MWRVWTLLTVLLLSGPVRADSPLDDYESVVDPNISDPEPWAEGSYTIPPFPEEDRLVEFDITGPDRGFRYFIDAKSLAVGDDGVVRYTVVIDSSQSRNVIFEGIHCGEREVKAYAYGTVDGRFEDARRPDWKRIRSGGAFHYRSDLQRFLLCDRFGLPLPVDESLRRLHRSDEFIER
ncbi:MAG: CNP1-like family protein [Chromatiales bacterium]|nr:CNP1-like family protein [Chromatiales bacterium]